MTNNQFTKTEYEINITNLNNDVKLELRHFVNKKLNRKLKNSNSVDFQKLYISIVMNLENALYKNFKSLKDLRAIFKTNEDCIKFLEELIWMGEPVSPFDSTSKVYKCKDGWYKCKNTGKEFNILTGTLFQGTKIDLTIWFEIIYREHSDKKGLAATTIMRDYGISHTTAWFMLHKIRNTMGFENHQGLKGIVETDEYYEGGSLQNMHYDKKLEAKKNYYQNKKTLQGFVERNGNATIRVVSDLTESTINAGILRYVSKNSTLYTDDNPSYEKLPPIYNRGTVIHSKGNYVNKENKNIYTNTIESLWATFERMKETHVHVSQKHLQNYANEAVFRYNTRKLKASDTCFWFLQNIESTKITWEEIRNAQYRRYNRNQTRAA